MITQWLSKNHLAGAILLVIWPFNLMTIKSCPRVKYGPLQHPIDSIAKVLATKGCVGTIGIDH